MHKDKRNYTKGEYVELIKHSKEEVKGSSAGSLASSERGKTLSCVHTRVQQTHTHPCPAAREQCFGKHAWMFAGLQSQTEQPLGVQQTGGVQPPVCMSLLTGK